MKKDIVIQKIVPMIAELIKDEHHEVKMGVLQGIQQVALVVGPEIFSGPLLMSLSNLMKESQWRVRLAVVTLVSNLAVQFGKEFYAKNLETIFLLFLTDTASTVRDIGTEKLQLLANEFKADWVINGYLPKAVELLNKEKLGYLHRTAALSSIASLTVALSKEQIGIHLIPILLKYCKDPIANVKFCLAKLLAKIIPKLDAQTLNSKVKPMLAEMANDPDKDVQYFSKIALNLC